MTPNPSHLRGPASVLPWLLAMLTAFTGLHAVGTTATPRTRDGWRLELLLEPPVLHHPSVVATAPDGRIFVAEDPMDIRTARADAREGRILCRHPDGRVTVFVDGLHAVFGMQYLEGRLYVLHNPRFTAYTDAGDRGTEPVDLIRQTLPQPWALDWNDHIPSNFELAMDGHFHVAVGDKGLFGARGTDGREVRLHGGGVVRIRPDGTGLEIVATGLRNILDVALSAEDDLFTFDNTDEHDWMGRVTHVIEGGYYGYPHDFSPRQPGVLWCLADVGAGAACGALVYEEDGLPDAFRGNLFLADFGKRQILRGRLVPSGASWRIAPANAITGPPEVAGVGDFEALFPDPPEDFRPVGICVDADGRGLLVCDWQHRDVKDPEARVGRLWRLAWAGPSTVAARPDWWIAAASGRPFTATPAALAAALDHPARSVRLTAQRRLADRIPGDPDLRATLVRAAADRSLPARARIHSLWALASRAPAGLLETLATDPDPSVARQALRLAGEDGSADVPDAARRATDPAFPAPVRLAAATALGRRGRPGTLPALTAALADSDSHVRHAAFTALRRIGMRHPDAWPILVAGLDHPTEPVREGIRLAVRGVPDVALIGALADRATRRSGTEDGRRIAVGLLRHGVRLEPEWDGSWWAYHPALQPPPARTRRWEGTPRAQRALQQAVDDPVEDIRTTAVAALADLADPSDRSLLADRLGIETKPAVQAALVRALAVWADSSDATRLASLFGRGDLAPEVAEAVLEAAPAFGESALSRIALEAARDTAAMDSVRRAAFRALGRLRPEGYREAAASAIDAGGGMGVAALGVLDPAADPAVRGILVRAFDHADGDLRNAALAAAGRWPAPEQVVPLLAAWQRSETRAPALAALAAHRDPQALDAWLDGLGARDAVLRSRCREAVAAVRDRVLPRLIERAPHLSPRVIAELQEVYADRSGDVARALFENRSPGPEDYAQAALRGGGDPVAGQRLFFDPAGVACIRCHAVAGHGAVTGPDLTLIGAQFGRTELVEAVLYPGRTVREGYQQYLIEMRDGTTHAGAIRSESGSVLTLVDGAGAVVSLDRDGVVRREATGQSLMPDGLQAGLSPEEFTDLIAYLESRTSDPRQPASAPVEPGFRSLIPPGELSGWRELPEGTRRVDAAALALGRPPEHWALRDERLVHDGRAGDLWTAREFGDIELRLEWRWPDLPVFQEFPVILRDGRDAVEPDGKPVVERVLDAGDSGILLRGLYRAQINLFCYPVGSGESWEYRTDRSLPAEVRQALTPARTMDRPIGDWNAMEILLRDDRVTVRLNGVTVITGAQLPELPARGPLGLQHEHGRIEFRNLRIREFGSE